MKKVFTSLLFVSLSTFGFSQTDIAVDPNSRYQTLEGWGVSLAWWANVAGGWSDAKIDTLCTWLTSPSGLNMNIFRFNIAGGDTPSHNHMRYAANLQGYKVSETSAYDFTRDATQRKILQKIKSKRSDCIFEAIAYSPPYWMTKSSCSAGNGTSPNPATDNLKDTYYDDFADYLTEVVKYYHDSLNITFRTLAPINEPSSTWWYYMGSQEGCHFSDSNMVKIFTEVYNKLQSKGMSYCTLSAMDCSNAEETTDEINNFVSNDMMFKISQINTHDYTSPETVTQYQELYNLAKTQNKKTWVSETGPLSGFTGEGFVVNLQMTDALFRDMRNLKPVAWCDWQYMDGGLTWGHVQYDSVANFRKAPNYFARMQVTRFIKPGYTIINSNDAATLAAMNATNDTMVLVLNNSGLTSKSYRVDLNLFGSVGSAAQVYRTTSGMEGAHYDDSAYNVYTYQTKTGLTNGTYTAKAWVRSSGGQTKCYLEAKNYGGSALTANISQSFDYVQVTISNIVVTNGQCTIGIYSECAANKWCAFDDIELYLNSNPGTNYLTNPGFESDITSTQTPGGWSTGGSHSDADFTQSGSHGNNEQCARLTDISIANNIFSFTAHAKSISTFIVPVTQAAASPITSGNYRITAKHSNKDMSVAGWSETDGAVIEQWSPLGQANQVFNVQVTPTGYKLLPSYNAKAVTVNGYSTANGAIVNQWADGEQQNQRFSIIDAGGGYYKIVARHSGKCLTVTGNGTNNGDDVVQWEWLNYDNAKWQFTAVQLDSTIANGTYNIKARHSSKMMSVAGWSSSNGAVIEQWDSLCQDNEKFTLQFTSAGYIIKPYYNSKVVSVNNYSVANGAAVVQWDDLNQQHQRYQIVSLGGGYYKIVCRYTNKCIAVTGGGTNNGDDVVQWEWLDYDNFKWAFKTPCNQAGRPVNSATVLASDPVDLSVNVLPNPTPGMLNIRFDNIDNAQLAVFDISGRLLFQGKAINNMNINLKKYPLSNVCLIKITGTNRSIVKKIIIQ